MPNTFLPEENNIKLEKVFKHHAYVDISKVTLHGADADADATNLQATFAEQKFQINGLMSSSIRDMWLTNPESEFSIKSSEFQEVGHYSNKSSDLSSHLSSLFYTTQLGKSYQHGPTVQTIIYPHYEMRVGLKSIVSLDNGTSNPSINGLWGGLDRAAIASGNSRAMPEPTVVQGQIVAGPVLPGNSLLLKVYDFQEHLLTTSQVDSSGRYKLEFGQYSGPVVMLVVDMDNTKPDYVDEVTKKPIDLHGALMATAIVSSGSINQVININPITTAAAIKAGVQLSPELTGVQALVPVTLQGQSLLNAVQAQQTRILNAGSAVAKALGLGTTIADLVQAPIVPTVNVDGTTNSSANHYGKLLAAVAGMDAANDGDSSQTLTVLVQGITDTGALTATALAALTRGAQLAGVSGALVGPESIFTPKYSSALPSTDQSPRVLEFTVSKTLLVYGDTAKIRLVFDEPVYNLTPADLTFLGGSVTQWTRSVDRKTWTGLLKVHAMSFSASNELLLSGSYQDGAGNLGPKNIKSTNFAIDNLVINESDVIQVSGPPGQANIGTSLAFLGDLNGDGRQELAIGAPMWRSDITSYSAGAVFIVQGTANLSNVTLMSEPQNMVRPTDSAAIESGFGLKVTGVGDIDADGIPDVAISAPYFNGSSGYESGLVYLLRGNTNGTLSLPQDDKDMLGWQFFGASERSSLGWSVTAAGDFNGDGYDDTLLGAPFASTSGAADAGQAVLILGGLPNQDLKRLTVWGQNPGDWLGYSVAGGGDINGDGLSDVVISAPDADITGLSSTSGDAGAVYVLYGNKEEQFSLTDAAAGVNGRLIKGFSEQHSAGHSVAMVGDVNGDGYADMLIGAPDHLSSQGAAWLVWGGADNSQLDLSNPGNRAVSFYSSTQPAGQLGASVAAAGDFNCDGYADFILTAPGANNGAGEDSGISYLIFGKPTASWTSEVNVSPYGFRAALNGTASGDASFGIAVAGNGDINGDGLPDIVVSFPNALEGRGASKILLGSDVYITVPHTTGTATNDIILNSDKSEVLIGKAGDDTIYAGSGDLILAGPGSDVIILNEDWLSISNDGLRTICSAVDGGSGSDTLKITGSIQWDWASDPMFAKNIKSIEKIDLTDNEQQTLRISSNNIINTADVNTFNSVTDWLDQPSIVNAHQLLVVGNSNDILYIEDSEVGWTQDIGYFDSLSYQIYTNNTKAVQLLVLSDVQVNWNASPL